MQINQHNCLIGAFSFLEEANKEMSIAYSKRVFWQNGLRKGVLNLPFRISQPPKAQSLHCKIIVLLQDKLCAKQMLVAVWALR